MTTSPYFASLRHDILNLLEDSYPAALSAEDAALSAPFSPTAKDVLEALESLQNEGLVTPESLQKDTSGHLTWHQCAITARGIDYLASHSNMSHTLESGSKRVHEDCLQPILKEALLLTDEIPMSEKKTYLERLKNASDSELSDIAKELKEKKILKQSSALF